MRITNPNRNSILKRGRTGGKTARLTAFARRLALPVTALILILWLGVWAALSGLPGDVASGIRHRYDRVTAEMGFSVQAILVEGRVNTDPDLLFQLIGMKRGDPILAFHPGRVQARLEQVPWIKAAKVERRLPSTIFVALTERVPAALWQTKGQLKLIDDTGFVLADKDLAPFKNLLLVVGADAPAHMLGLETLLAGQPALRGRVLTAVYVSDRRWDLQLRGGTIVKLPEQDPALALARLARTQQEDGLLDKNPVSIDMRESDRLVVTPGPGQAQAYKTGNDI
jgi:cell division protein FtsQ